MKASVPWCFLLGSAWLACLLGTVIPGSAQTLGEALNNTNLTWICSSAGNWLVETNDTHDGLAAQSPASGFSPTTIQTTIQGPATVSFWWRESIGTFGCTVGDVPVAAISADTPFWLDPPTAWLPQTVYIGTGPQIVAWTHTPLVTSPFIAGAGFLDQVSVDPGAIAPIIASQPHDQSSLPGFVARFTVSAVGTPPLGYQWQFGGTALPGATNSVLTMTNLGSADFGTFNVIVTNSFGTNVSSSASLMPGPTVGWGRLDKGQIFVPRSSFETVAIAAGQYHSLALAADGSVSAWGDNEAGQTTVPPGLPPIVAVAAGDWQSLALTAKGTVAEWGKFVRPQTASIFVQVDQAAAPAGLTNVVAVAGGTSYGAALRADGTVAAWGRYLSPGGYYWLYFPDTLNISNAVAIAGGANHLLALQSDGTLVSAGAQTDVPPGLTNVIAIAAGAVHSLALKGDGTVFGWDDSGYGEAVVPDGLSNVVAIAAGGYDSVALKGDGTLVTWGLNDYQQLLLPAPLTNVAAVACGGEHSLALVGTEYPKPFLLTPLVDRQAGVGGKTLFYAAASGASSLAYQWQRDGTNLPGAVGPILSIPGVHSTDAGGYRIVVTNPFGSVTSSVAVLTVYNFSDALNTTNIVWAASDIPWFVQSAVTLNGPAAAQSGAITTNQTSTLQTSLNGPGVLTFWWKVSSTTNHGVVSVKVNGQTQAAISGQVDWRRETLYLGSGSQLVQWAYTKDAAASTGLDAGWLAEVNYTPGAVAPLITQQPASVSQGPGLIATFSVTAVGTPPLSYQWQMNGNSIADATDSFLVITNVHAADLGTYRVVVSNMVDRAVSADATLTLAEVVAWGQNSYGQANVPLDLTNVAAIAGGWHHSVALTLDGTVWAWGANDKGQTNVPPGLSNVVAIASRSGDHSTALRADGTVVVWGDNSYGQTNVPAGLSNVIAISAGGNHCLALKSDGTVISWGYLTAVPGGLSNVVAISAGDNASLFLKSDGTIAATGTIVPGGLSNIVAIAAGGLHNLLLRSDGTVAAWGNNSYGQTSIPAGLAQVVAIAAGDYHSAALRADGTVVDWGDYYTGSSYVLAKQPAGLTNVLAIAAGSDHDLAFFGNASVPPALKLLDPKLANGVFSVTVPSEHGHVYRLEYNDSMESPEWIALPLVAGRGGQQILSDTSAAGAQRFYRVVRW